MMYLYSAEPEIEDSHTQVRRRLQQRRCLACGARQLVNRATSYFCAAHIASYRYCSTCETLRTREEHGRDSRCKSCSAARSLAYYRANTEQNIYYQRLKAIARRQCSRADQIFMAMRRRIALADLVARTPGWSWERRAALVGMDKGGLAERYARQCRGACRDVDTGDRMLRRRP